MKIGKMRIVITENEDFSIEVIDKLKKYGEVFTFNTKSKNELLQCLKDADIAFIRLRFNINKEIIDLSPKLKYILTATTGLDHIDWEYFEKRGGKVISLRGEYQFLSSIPSTAEHTWGLLLTLMRKSFSAFNDVKEGFWRRDLFKGNNLSGKKIGILGLGRVGAQIAQYAKAFNLEIAFYDIVDKKDASFKKFNSAEELFSWADIITIHIPLNENTYHFVGKELMDKLSNDAVIVNTSRGAIIDEDFLAIKIENKEIKGYATDVLENELDINIVNNKIVQLSNTGFNVIITPHIAGATFESMYMTENFIFEKFTKEFYNNGQ